MSPNIGKKSSGISLRNVSKLFGAVQVLKNVTLDIPLGQRVVICGPSGSGKSTLIRCINRLESIDQGTVTVNGVDSASLEFNSSTRFDIGMVFQQFNLFPHLTVLQNCILAPIRVRRVPRKAAEARALEVLDKIGLADQSRKYPSQLSGGQQQRVAITRTLCMEPRIILLDEPTSALDPEMVGEVLEMMVSLADLDMTMVCVTHEMGFARAVAHKIVFMDGGMIIEQSVPEKFFGTPSTSRAREFLGKII